MWWWKNSLEYKLFSEYIKDHDKKNCNYFGGQCKDFYKNCEDFVDIGKCSGNVMEGYLFNVCGFNSDNKCEKKILLSISQTELHLIRWLL